MGTDEIEPFHTFHDNALDDVEALLAEVERSRGVEKNLNHAIDELGNLGDGYLRDRDDMFKRVLPLHRENMDLRARVKELEGERDDAREKTVSRGSQLLEMQKVARRLEKQVAELEKELDGKDVGIDYSMLEPREDYM